MTNLTESRPRLNHGFTFEVYCCLTPVVREQTQSSPRLNQRYLKCSHRINADRKKIPGITGRISFSKRILIILYMISIILFVGFFIKVIPARIKRLDTVPIRPNPTESRPKLNPEFFFSGTAWSLPWICKSRFRENTK